MEELAWGLIGQNDAAIVGIVRDVATRPAGHQDFDARTAILFDDEDALAAFAGPNGRQQPRRSCADDNDFPDVIHCVLHGMLFAKGADSIHRSPTIVSQSSAPVNWR